MGAVTLHRSASAQARLDAAHRFVESLPAASEALIVGAARDAVDDFVRENAARRGAAFGLHRFSLRRLAARIASSRLAARGLAPATRLGAEAVATRAAFEAARPVSDEAGRGALGYLAPIAKLRSFGRTLASTLEEIRGAGVEADALSACGAVGADLDALSGEYARQLEAAGLVDLPALYRLATDVVTAGEPVDVPLDVPVVLLDVPVHDRAARDLVRGPRRPGRAAARDGPTGRRPDVGGARPAVACGGGAAGRSGRPRPPRWRGCATGSSSPSRLPGRRTPVLPARPRSIRRWGSRARRTQPAPAMASRSLRHRGVAPGGRRPGSPVLLDAGGGAHRVP